MAYCVELNRRLKFDSMAYDVLFRDGEFVITEISYAYVDRAIEAAPHHYELEPDGTCRRIDGHAKAQSLWVDWLLHEAVAQGNH